MNKTKEEKPWVLLNIAGIKYGISCEHVLSLNEIGKTTPFPRAPREIKGLVDFRGVSVPLVDIKSILAAKSKETDLREFNTMMDARFQDHMNWLAALEKSVKENAEFKLTTDPHKCAFGRWYDSYDTKNSGIMFSITFSRFNFPHMAIHAIAKEAQAYVANGEHDKAAALIEATREKELRQMMGLFDDIKTAYKEVRREILVTFGKGRNCVGIAVDEIVSTERLCEFDEKTLACTCGGSKVLYGLGKRKSGEPVFLLNDEYFLETFSKALV